MTEILISIFALAALAAVIVPISLYFAWAAHILWGWFIVGTIPGAPPLTILQIWGITLALSMLRPKVSFSKDENKDWAGGLVALILAPPISLAFGYAIKFWWM